MDVLTIVQITLVVPFLLLLAIIAIVYLKDGYKKDFVRSLLSLVATSISVVFSLLLSKGISRLVSEPMLSLLPPRVAEYMAMRGDIWFTIAQVVIEVAVSFLLFGLFFFITLAIFKAVSKKIPLGKLEKLSAGKVGTRLVGMVIRGVDAVLVTLMLLLPVYGTIATVAPPAAVVARIGENAALFTLEGESAIATQQQEIISDNQVVAEEPSVFEALDVVANHPVLLPYKYGPGAWVYSGLSGFSLNGKTVDVVSAANSLVGLLDRLQACMVAIEAEDVQGATGAVDELIDYTRQEVIYQQWSYDMAMAFVGELDTFVENESQAVTVEEELTELYAQMRPLLDMSFEEYTHNAEGVLDFVDWLMEMYSQYGESILSEESPVIQGEELYIRLGSLLNNSEQMVGLKRLVLQTCAQEMFNDMPDSADPEYADYYDTRRELPNSGVEFVNKYFGDGFVPEEKRLAEAGAFFALLNAYDKMDVAEVFARHPLFGADAVIESTDEYLYIHSALSEETIQQFASTERGDAFYKGLDNLLRDCENVDFNHPLEFSYKVYDYVNARLY